MPLASVLNDSGLHCPDQTYGSEITRVVRNIPAFTIANTLDAAQSHLMIGPILGAIIGAFAGVSHVLEVDGSPVAPAKLPSRVSPHP
jgi:hypothetical protein